MPSHHFGQLELPARGVVFDFVSATFWSFDGDYDSPGIARSAFNHGSSVFIFKVNASFLTIVQAARAPVASHTDSAGRNVTRRGERFFRRSDIRKNFFLMFSVNVMAF